MTSADRVRRPSTLDGSRVALRREGIREDAGLVTQRLVIAAREDGSRFVVGSGPLRNGDGKQLAGALHGVDAKQDDVVDREHHGDEPEAECHRRDDGEGGERRAGERAERVEDVAREVIDEGDATGVTALIGSQRHRSEARARPAASLDRPQSCGDVLLRLALDMKREFLVELALDAAGSQQRANAQEEIADVHRAHASFITRPMAVDMRSHSPASTASCRRPGTVSL